MSRSSSLASNAAAELASPCHGDEPHTESGRPSVRMVRLDCEDLDESGLASELLALLEAYTSSTESPHGTLLLLVVGPKSLPRLVSLPVPEAPPAGFVEPPASDQTRDVRCEVRAFERERIVAALRRTGGNQTEAAKILGVSRRTLTNKLNAHGLPRPRKRAKEQLQR